MPFRSIASLCLLLVATTAWTTRWYAQGTEAWQVDVLEARRGALEVAIAALEPDEAEAAPVLPVAAARRLEAGPVPAAAPAAPAARRVAQRGIGSDRRERPTAEPPRESARARSAGAASASTAGRSRVCVVVSGVDAVVIYGDCAPAAGADDARASAGEVTLTWTDPPFGS